MPTVASRAWGGARIDLSWRDNAGGSAGTASEAHRLITAGPLVTSEMRALVPVLDEHKVLASHSPAVTAVRSIYSPYGGAPVPRLM